MATDESDRTDSKNLEKAKLESVIEREYSNHQDQLFGCAPSPERVTELESALIKGFGKAIEYREVPFVRFGELNARELAEAFVAYPVIVKPTLGCVNVAQRAISRDLGFDFDTYSTRITIDQALVLAGYIKPLLPPTIAIPALMELDRYFWTDKQLRATKGNWEKSITDAINRVSSEIFRKRRFECDGENFELDAAYPAKTGAIKIGVDIKRIESRRDIHKRADEIINKASKFKRIFPEGKFVALVYYPFPDEHVNAKSRLHSPHIDAVFFAAASESSIQNAAEMMVGMFGLRRS
jgi:hypothetical protein